MLLLIAQMYPTPATSCGCTHCCNWCHCQTIVVSFGVLLLLLLLLLLLWRRRWRRRPSLATTLVATLLPFAARFRVLASSNNSCWPSSAVRTFKQRRHPFISSASIFPTTTAAPPCEVHAIQYYCPCRTPLLFVNVLKTLAADTTAHLWLLLLLFACCLRYSSDAATLCHCRADGPVDESYSR